MAWDQDTNRPAQPHSISRTIQPAVEAALFKSKVVVIYGARQVGKTTLVRAILDRHPDRGLYLNCDEPDIREALT